MDYLEGTTRICALQETPLLYANKHGIGVMGVKIDVLRMGDGGRRREGPLGRIHRPQSRELRPTAAEIIARKQVRWLRSGEKTWASGQSGARQAIDVVLCEPVVAPLPGVAAIAAGKNRAVVRSRED